MAKLPDISDLLKAEKKSAGLQKKYEKIQQEMQDNNKRLREIQLKVIDRYNAASICPQVCDHPVIRYCGMGEDECECCGEARPERKYRQ